MARASFHMVTGKHVNYMANVVCSVGGGLRWLVVTSAVTIFVLPPVATDITGKSNIATVFVWYRLIYTSYGIR